MAKISKIVGRQVFDSRGNPTVEAEVFLNNKVKASAIVPGPAFVIMQSQANMYSDMLFTKPWTSMCIRQKCKSMCGDCVVTPSRVPA